LKDGTVGTAFLILEEQLWMEKFLLRNVGVPNSYEIDVYIERGG